MGLMKKLENRYFLILKFCFHEATLQAYLARSVCAMDMVDSALKTLDVALLKYDKSFGTLEEGKYLRTSFDPVTTYFLGMSPDGSILNPYSVNQFS